MMNFEVVAPPHHDQLADLIAKKLGKQIIEPHITRFADSEIKVTFANPSVMAKKVVFIIQSTSMPVHDKVMQFLLIVHKIRAAGAQKIVGVIPYFGYSRQDSMRSSHDKGSLELVAQLIKAAGVDELIAVDFHSPLIDTFFSIPVHNIQALDVIAAHCKATINLEGACVVSPDNGAKGNAQLLAHKIGIECIHFAKERYAPDKTRLIDSTIEVNAKTAIIIDDIIDTGNTVLNVCYALHQKGVTKIYGYFVHPVLSEDAVNSIDHSYFDRVFVSNSIALEQESERIEQFDISDVLVEKIKEMIKK